MNQLVRLQKALKTQLFAIFCMKMRKDGIENIHNRLSNALIVQNTDRT